MAMLAQWVDEFLVRVLGCKTAGLHVRSVCQKAWRKKVPKGKAS